MTRPVFPEAPVASDAAWMAERERLALLGSHWKRGWLRRFERDKNGAIVRIRFVECDEACPCRYEPEP